MPGKGSFRPMEDSSEDDDPAALGQNSTKKQSKLPSLSRLKLFGAPAQATVSDVSNVNAEHSNNDEPEEPVSIPDSTSDVITNSKKDAKKVLQIPSNDSSKSQTPLSSPSKTKGRFGSFLKNSDNNSKSADIEPEPTDKPKKVAFAVEAKPIEDEDDPVMALFEARSTQRVRFSLEDEPKERGKKRRNLSKDGSPMQLEESIPGKVTTKDTNSQSSNKSAFNIKKFMKSALFGSNSKVPKSVIDEFEEELAREIDIATKKSAADDAADTVDVETLMWGTSPSNELQQASSNDSVQVSPFLVADSKEAEDEAQLLESSFEEDSETRATFLKFLNKARRAQFVYYRYQYAVRTYVKALDVLKQANYPDTHPMVVKTLKSLNNAHFAVSSLKNSANIVKLGIKYEDSGELIRALKMYTIAYRIRRDNLSATHPSLVVLLNMLGSIQIKRGELSEAMAIYELALKDSAPSSTNKYSAEEGCSQFDGDFSTREQLPPRFLSPIVNFLTCSVSYREMGTIYQEWGDTDKALEMYHRSLECMAHHKGLSEQYQSPLHSVSCLKHQQDRPSNSSGVVGSTDVTESQSYTEETVNCDEEIDGGGMEVSFSETTLAKSEKSFFKKVKKADDRESITPTCYDIFFPIALEEKMQKKKGKKSEEVRKGDYADIEIAQTIHRIAQLHRSEELYDLALPIFNVALRGMKYALGKTHPNVAAILGNIGNLQKEMGDLNASYQTYQQVLAIESYRLGLSHPDVVITLHNIATIDAARGNLEHAMSLYTQVISLQRKLFGEDHESVAVTSACMGDVFERTGDSHAALECYEEALRIKISAFGRHSLECARLLHKLGKLAVAVNDYHLALSYLSKAALVYKLNELPDDDEWVIDVSRDAADVEASIAMGRGVYFEC